MGTAIFLSSTYACSTYHSCLFLFSFLMNRTYRHFNCQQPEYAKLSYELHVYGALRHENLSNNSFIFSLLCTHAWPRHNGALRRHLYILFKYIYGNAHICFIVLIMVFFCCFAYRKIQFLWNTFVTDFALIIYIMRMTKHGLRLNLVGNYKTRSKVKSRKKNMYKKQLLEHGHDSKKIIEC